jgi:hypothetical protein
MAPHRRHLPIDAACGALYSGAPMEFGCDRATLPDQPVRRGAIDGG